MATPSVKNPFLVQQLDEVAKQMFGITRTEAITTDVCISCRKPATTFTDEQSQREYTISGLCQPCQDATFADPHMEE